MNCAKVVTLDTRHSPHQSLRICNQPQVFGAYTSRASSSLCWASCPIRPAYYSLHWQHCCVVTRMELWQMEISSCSRLQHYQFNRLLLPSASRYMLIHDLLGSILMPPHLQMPQLTSLRTQTTPFDDGPSLNQRRYLQQSSHSSINSNRKSHMSFKRTCMLNYSL